MQKLLAYHYQSNYDHKSGLNITKTLHRQFRGYARGDSQNAPESEDGNDGDVGADSEEDMYTLLPDSESQDESIKIEIEKTGKNSRRITSKVAVQASLQSVWHTLTDYERLADFIPGLAVSQLLEKRDNFARLFQVAHSFFLLFLENSFIDVTYGNFIRVYLMEIMFLSLRRALNRCCLYSLTDWRAESGTWTEIQCKSYY